MSDVSPQINEPGRGSERSPEEIGRLYDAARDLSHAVNALATAVAEGSGIERAEARDRYEIALSEFSMLLDQTAE